MGVEELIKKAASDEVQERADDAKKSLKFQTPFRLLRHYHIQKYGEISDNINFEKLAEEFEKDEFKLKEQHAELANHELVAHAVEKAVPSVGNQYKSAIDKYINEKNGEKKAEIMKELQMYRQAGQKLNLNERQLTTMKRRGYDPNTMDSFYRNVDQGFVENERQAFLEAIDDEKAIEAAKKVAGKFEIPKDRVTRPDYAKQVLLTEYAARTAEDPKKKFWKALRDSDILLGLKDPYKAE
ncbi:hypothetical protein GF323_01390 [Candidatus Woesearchaeota archaeon]|nr:hypothetical protein [Candidatus Woesearchaeota archaeon]